MRSIICFHKPEEINGFLSNWYASRFQDVNGICYTSVEQYMMYQKAMLFRDTDIAEQIMKTERPGKIKALGRQVASFQEAVWSAQKYETICCGIQMKFMQNKTLREKLLSYDSHCIFAECAMQDIVWGIGLSMHDPDRFDISRWKGENLLGKAITQVRDMLLACRSS